MAHQRSAEADADPESLRRRVEHAVREVRVVDVHTHLFPPTYGDLMQFGVDSLLTYHYLVSELFSVRGCEETPAEFFRLSRREQADRVWHGLFVHRSPLSEACRGVLTTFHALGLGDHVRARDLSAIRNYFDGLDRSEYVDTVFDLAGVDYCVMTNVPFSDTELSVYQDNPAPHPRFKASVRLDPFLTGDWSTIARALEREGLPISLSGARAFLESWAARLAAVYFMASTPAGFVYLADQRDSMGQPDLDQAPQSLSQGKPSSAIATELIDHVLMPVATKLGLPLALKIGAVRGANPDLNPCGGGDGVETADISFLLHLARRYNVKLLATVLSRSNQHELCVLSNKLPNLHIYGCWWYCNNPSIIDEITRIRVELLGTGFTAQHSDARVLDQLIYKWGHSRRVISAVLVEKYLDLANTGWVVTDAEIQRDVRRLFGESYHEFLRT